MRSVSAIVACLVVAILFPEWAFGQEIRLVRRKADPYGSPRPSAGAEHVPVRTSIWFELELHDAEPADRIVTDSVTLSLKALNDEPRPVLLAGRRFEAGSRGWLRPRSSESGGLMVYADPGFSLKPATTYTAHVAARSLKGAQVSAKAATWTFTTEETAAEADVRWQLDLNNKPVHWQGGFFTGICNVVFCTDAETFGPLYRMMRESHEQHPRAWRFQRDIWLTASDDWKPDWATFMDPRWPNIVRERQTRRITAVAQQGDGLLLRVEDVFGCEQYGVKPGRPLSEDYQVGYEVLVADGTNDARSKVLAVDDKARTVLVVPVATPTDGWLIDFKAVPQQQDNPDAPGRFAAGGAYLRRFNPPGDPVYFWGRLDKEFDLAHRVGGRRLAVNFVEAPSDLSLTGRPYTRPKDYAEWHEVVRTMTDHLIDRYGDASSDFAWSVFNEPDLVGDYWRFHWDEVQRFYDYTVDAVLRAFEDRGYDSDRVFVGGWELGAIFGTHLRLREILAHCSPRAEAEGTLEHNAAFADSRLDGKRSQRVERLCKAHDGKGSPCDFISIHTYNRSDMAAAKLIRAKEMALEADAAFYRDVWINTHESCPNWSPPPDEAAADSYLGNGYFSSWCFDVVHRQLVRSADDPRYAFGESVITIWPPPADFAGLNTLARRIHVDDDGDGLSDRTVPVAAPIFHALTLLSDFGPDYWVLSQKQIGGHTIGGFTSLGSEGVIRLALFSHHGGDIQSRSDHRFRLTLDVAGVPGNGPLRVTRYRFDSTRNTYFGDAVRLRNSAATADAKVVESLIRELEEGDDSALSTTFETIKTLDRGSLVALAPAFQRRVARLTNPALREAAREIMRGVFESTAAQAHGYARKAVERVQELAKLQSTTLQQVARDANGHLLLTVELDTNGVNIVVIEPKITVGENGLRE